MEIDWGNVIEKGGIAGVSIAILYFGYQFFKLFISQWKNSTDSLNKNTAAFTKLSTVFEKQAARDEVFQREITTLLKEGIATSEDTNKKVTELHVKVIGKTPEGV